MSLYDRYKKEIAEEVKIDAFNIKDAAMLAPSKKHFWAARLNDHRIEIQDLKSKKAKIIRALVEKADQNSPVKLSKVNLEKMVEDMPEIQDLDSKIKEQENLIAYLEDERWTFSKLTEDIKNVIEIMKLEQL
jgi:hypothetical protein